MTNIYLDAQRAAIANMDRVRLEQFSMELLERTARANTTADRWSAALGGLLIGVSLMGAAILVHVGYLLDRILSFGLAGLMAIVIGLVFGLSLIDDE